MIWTTSFQQKQVRKKKKNFHKISNVLATNRSSTTFHKRDNGKNRQTKEKSNHAKYVYFCASLLFSFAKSTSSQPSSPVNIRQALLDVVTINLSPDPERNFPRGNVSFAGLVQNPGKEKGMKERKKGRKKERKKEKQRWSDTIDRVGTVTRGVKLIGQLHRAHPLTRGLAARWGRRDGGRGWCNFV